MSVSNHQIAEVFSNKADLMELKGKVVFKIRAYQRAARTIEHLPGPLEQMVWEEQDLQKIPGIGEAMSNPHVDIIAHPTGRLLGEREPIEVDMEALLQAAAVQGVAMEINASPERLDIKDTHILRAKELGVPMAMDSDVHRIDSLDSMRFGVAMARRGWCEAYHTLNTRPLKEIMAWLNPERS